MIQTQIFLLRKDLAVMVEAVKFARKVAQQEPLASMITGIFLSKLCEPTADCRTGNDILPGPDVQTNEDIAGM